MESSRMDVMTGGDDWAQYSVPRQESYVRTRLRSPRAKYQDYSATSSSIWLIAAVAPSTIPMASTFSRASLVA